MSIAGAWYAVHRAKAIEAGKDPTGVNEAVAQLTELGKSQPEVQAFVDFIGRSTRSLVR